MSLRKRVIPCLLIKNNVLVKTSKFRRPKYIGDPINTGSIFNDFEVDEIIILDIDASKLNRLPNYELLGKISSEIFVPLAYGGGINSFEIARKIFSLGYEKIVLNSALYYNPQLVKEIINVYGSQSVIASIDYKKDIFGNSVCYYRGLSKKFNSSPLQRAIFLESLGVGEVMLTAIQLENSWSGLDVDFINEITKSISIPTIAHGGCGTTSHIKEGFEIGGASAVAIGSMIVYKSKNLGILISFPEFKVLN